MEIKPARPSRPHATSPNETRLKRRSSGAAAFVTQDAPHQGTIATQCDVTSAGAVIGRYGARAGDITERGGGGDAGGGGRE